MYQLWIPIRQGDYGTEIIRVAIRQNINFSFDDTERLRYIIFAINSSKMLETIAHELKQLDVYPDT